MKEKIKHLTEITGCGFYNCRKALELFEGNEKTAYEYLKLKSQPVVRYKIVNGKRIFWTNQDYINKAKELSQDSSVG